MELKKFSLFGYDFAFTGLNDSVSMYSFGARYYVDGMLIKDTTKRENWHKIGFGFYRRSDSWIN